MSSIPVGEDDLIRQSTKKATALQLLKIRESQKYSEYLFNS